MTSNPNSFFRGAIRGRAGPTEVRIEGPVTTAAGVKGISMPRNTAKALGEWLIAVSGDLRKPDETDDARDAARYRCLRENPVSILGEDVCGASLDAIVDAERRAEEPFGKPEPSDIAAQVRAGFRPGYQTTCHECSPSVPYDVGLDKCPNGHDNQNFVWMRKRNAENGTPPR